MLKQMLNEVRFTFFIQATGPILIKEGNTDNNKKEKQQGEGQLMKFVEDANKRVLIPGSSIKGVWRSWCEKMARTISEGMPLACDPFNKTEYLFSWDEIPGNNSDRLTYVLKSNYDVDWVKKGNIVKTANGETIIITADKNILSLNLNNEKTELNLKINNSETHKFIVKNENGKLNIYKTDPSNQSCSDRFDNLKKTKKLDDTAFIYASSCPICKLFGNTSLASRIKISDAYPFDIVNQKELYAVTLNERDGIGIDRFTGGTSHGAKFRYQYIIGNIFKANIQIRNFELWQLGLLGYLFKDFKEELVPIGFGKTRGLGKVKGTIGEADLIFYGLNRSKVENNHANITGIGGLYKDKDNENYCFDTNASLQIEGIDPKSVTETAIKTTIKLNNIQADELFRKAADYWASLHDGKSDGYYKTAQDKRNKIPEGT